MPTVYRFGPHRFLFYSREHDPPHVHVESPDGWAIFELLPIRLRQSKGYTRRELNELFEIVIEQQERFLSRWHEHFNR